MRGQAWKQLWIGDTHIYMCIIYTVYVVYVYNVHTMYILGVYYDCIQTACLCGSSNFWSVCVMVPQYILSGAERTRLYMKWQIGQSRETESPNVDGV